MKFKSILFGYLPYLSGKYTCELIKEVKSQTSTNMDKLYVCI